MHAGSAQLGQVVGRPWHDWSQAGLQALQTKKGLKEGFAYLFTFSNISNAEILITIFS